MADARTSDRPTGSRPRSRLDGIIGRLVYVPAEYHQDVGQLHRSHARNETPYFQQVTDFTQWCAPTRLPTEGNDLPPWRLARAQKNWLLKNYPEAYLADEDTEALLLEELSGAGRPISRPLSSTARILSAGEISDLRDETHTVKGHPAVALASGESGQLLRIVSLDKEDWTWESADVRVRLSRPNFRLSGEWDHDGLPIALIKFAVDRKKHGPIRWLIVQKATSTTLFEPEIKSIPTRDTAATGPSNPSQISPNPLFTIRSDQTGGSSHSDASTVMPVGQSPRLAIIDQTGNWNVWDIRGRRIVRPKALKPVMIMRGNVTGSMSKLAAEQAQRILWLTVDRTAWGESDGSSSPVKSEDSRAGRELPRVLLMCTGTAVCLFDTEAQKVRSVTEVVLSNATRVLDMKLSPLHPSQAFILTNASLLWAKARKKAGQLSLDVLASCSHRKDSADPTLRLDISPAAYLGRRKACFACVRSKDSQMAIIWFIQPGPGMPVQYHRDIVSLRAPSSLTCIELFPVSRRVGPDAAGTGQTVLTRTDVKFFEILTLGENLDVNSALCAWLDDPHCKVAAPDMPIGNRPKRRQRRERLKFLRIIADAFVVPDGYEDHSRVAEDSWVSPDTEELPAQKATNFRFFSSRTTNRQEGDSNQVMDVDFDVVSRLKADGIMARRSLLDLAGDRSTEELFRIIADWEARQEPMDLDGLRRLPIGFRQSRQISSLVESLERVFVDLVKDDDQRQHRRNLIRRVAAEVFLSEVGITLEEPQAASDGTGHLQAAFQNSFTFCSSPPLEAFQEEPDLPKLLEEEQPVSLRLRQYTTMDPIIASKPVETALSSHWKLGADPDEIDFKPGKPDATDEVDDKRRRKMERRRRRAEKLASRGLSAGLSDGSAIVVGSQSQPPLIIMSQVPVITASQVAPEATHFGGSSQVVPQPMSQIVPGTYGGRPQKKVKKSGFR